jgi:hypothetical protein
MAYNCNHVEEFCCYFRMYIIIIIIIITFWGEELVFYTDPAYFKLFGFNFKYSYRWQLFDLLTYKQQFLLTS